MPRRILLEPIPYRSRSLRYLRPSYGMRIHNHTSSYHVTTSRFPFLPNLHSRPSSLHMKRDSPINGPCLPRSSLRVLIRVLCTRSSKCISIVFLRCLPCVVVDQSLSIRVNLLYPFCSMSVSRVIFYRYQVVKVSRDNRATCSRRIACPLPNLSSILPLGLMVMSPYSLIRQRRGNVCQLLARVYSIVNNICNMVMLQYLSSRQLCLLSVTHCNIIARPPTLGVSGRIIRGLLHRKVNRSIAIRFNKGPICIPRSHVVGHNVVSKPTFSPSLGRVPYGIHRMRPLGQPILPRVISVIPPKFSKPYKGHRLRYY